MGALGELKARVEGHSPGPWVYHASTNRVENVPEFDLHRFDIMAIGIAKVEESDADGELIAAAPKLLAALEAVVTELGMNAREYRRTADALNLQVIDRDPGRDAEAAARYASYAISWEAAELAVQRAIEEALR